MGVKSFVLFPKVHDNLKSVYGEEAHNPNGLVPRAIRMIKHNFPEAVVVTDVALDPYSSTVSLYNFIYFIFIHIFNIYFLLGT